MTSLDFLFIALGIGFLLLVIFMCVFLLQSILILRDVNKVTDNAKAITDRVRKAVIEPIEFLAEVSNNWSFFSDIINKLKERFSKDKQGSKEQEKEKRNEKKHGFKINKIKKE